MEKIIKQIQLPSGDIFDIYDEGAARASDLVGLASENYVDTKIANLINGAPETLDTLDELAAALEDNENIVEVLNAAIGEKASRGELDNLNEELTAEINELESTKVSKDGNKVLSANDFTDAYKEKLDGIAEGANKFTYTLPKASASVLGGVKIGENIKVNANGVISVEFPENSNIELDTSLTIAGKAADAKAVGDAFDALDTIIALDENSDGNVELRSYIQADEGNGDYTRLDSSLTVSGMAADAKAVGDAINLRMPANTVIPITKGGTGATVAADARANLGITLENLGAAAASHNHAASEITSGTIAIARIPTITVAKGGTGATDAATARSNLGITCANLGALATTGGTVTGTLTLSKTTDASGTSNTSPALIVGGTATTAHLAIDANEIIAKSNGTTPTTLNLGEVSTSSIISINGLFRMGTTNNYGTTLPAAGKSGRVFFKKVSS